MIHRGKWWASGCDAPVLELPDAGVCWLVGAFAFAAELRLLSLFFLLRFPMIVAMVEVGRCLVAIPGGGGG